MFHDIFCESYRIQRNAFAFDEYVSLVYEKFALHIIEIGLLNWIIFIFLMLLSLSQVFASQPIAPTCFELTSIYNSICTWSQVGSDKSFGQCDSHDRVCLDNRGIQIFTVLGTALLVLCIFFAFLSRHYEVSIINSRGLRSIEDYPTFLQKMEKVAFTSGTTAFFSPSSLLLLSISSSHNISSGEQTLERRRAQARSERGHVLIARQPSPRHASTRMVRRMAATPVPRVALLHQDSADHRSRQCR